MSQPKEVVPSDTYKKEADIDQAFAGLALLIYDLGYSAGYSAGRDARNEAR